MSIIEWKEDFSVGSYTIDEQHKELIRLINHVAESIKEQNYTFSNVLSVVYRLDQYIDQHLKYEEMLMDKYPYPGKEEHIREHNYARKRLEKLNVFDIENFEEKFLYDTLVWLVDWLTHHILHTDKLLNPYS
jgi:hemerythrin